MEDPSPMNGGVAEKPQQQQRPVIFAAGRRTGSSWNRGNSAWNVGAKDQKARRRVAQDVVNMNTAEDYEAAAANGKGEPDSFGDAEASFPSDDPRVQLHVQKEGGIFQVKGSVETVVDPDTLYGIITDYNSNARIFRNVDRVVVEDRGDEKVVTQFLHWNFLMWSGNYDIKMRMKNNPQNRSISYELAQPGFLKVFHGSWTVEPLATEGTAPTSKLILNQKALPSFFPPGPLAVGAGSYASRIMSSQVKNLLTDVATEASEIKKNTASSA